MGMFDTVKVPCPTCGKRTDFQSKGGDCNLEVYDLENAPPDVLSNVNRHSPYTCSCGTVFAVSRVGFSVVVDGSDYEYETVDRAPFAWWLIGGTDIFLASDFTPDPEHRDEWAPLYR